MLYKLHKLKMFRIESESDQNLNLKKNRFLEDRGGNS